jgi:amidophosphoribosyltransferase
LYFGRWRDAVVFSSESCAFHERDATIEREVYPGEVIRFDVSGKRDHVQAVPTHKPRQQCIFEPIYFARPDSRVFADEKEVGHFRFLLGRRLATERTIADAAVVPVPDSGRFAAVGYASESGLPLRELLVRNPYIPRTFQIAGQANREDLVRLKFTVMHQLLREYRRFVLVDDSLVRSTTLRILIAMIRDAAEETGLSRRDVEVHVRVASPPIIGCCYYGIDTPEMDELAAANQSIQEIAKGIDADSLEYLSLDGLDAVARDFEDPKNFCHACFTGRYPTQFLPRSR